MSNERTPVWDELKTGMKITGNILKETGKPIVEYAWEKYWLNYQRRKFRSGRRIW